MRSSSNSLNFKMASSECHSPVIILSHGRGEKENLVDCMFYITHLWLFEITVTSMWQSLGVISSQWLVRTLMDFLGRTISKYTFEEMCLDHCTKILCKSKSSMLNDIVYRKETNLQFLCCKNDQNTNGISSSTLRLKLMVKVIIIKCNYWEIVGNFLICSRTLLQLTLSYFTVYKAKYLDG